MHKAAQKHKRNRVNATRFVDMSEDLSEKLRVITGNFAAVQSNGSFDIELILSQLHNADEQQKQLRRQVVVGITMTLAAIGIPVNLLSAVVLVRHLWRKGGAYMLLLLLCLADIAVIGVHAYSITKSVMPVQKFNAALQCKMFKFFWHTSFQWSSWCIVLITAERLWSVTRPLGDQNSSRSRRHTCQLASLVTCLIVLFNVHIIFSTQFHTIDSVDVPGVNGTQQYNAMDHNNTAISVHQQPQLNVHRYFNKSRYVNMQRNSPYNYAVQR